jgi:hypothetical protein
MDQGWMADRGGHGARQQSCCRPQVAATSSLVDGRGGVQVVRKKNYG